MKAAYKVACAVAIAVCFAFVAWAQSPSTPNSATVKPLVLYDDFNGKQIDPAKWDDFTNPSGMREIVRELSPPYQGQGNDRRLHLFQRAYSWTGNDDGASYGYLALNFTNPASVTELSFEITINSAVITACQSNPSSAAVWAGFGGYFFNYGGQGNPDQDVQADINLFRDGSNPTGPLRVQADYVVMGQTTYQTLGYISPGKTATLRLKWDQPNHQFIFQVNNNPVVRMGYGSLPDTFPPYFAVKLIAITQGTPHCTTTPPASATMDAYVDNVYVNPH